MHGVHTYLHLRKRRYVCNTCGKRFYERNSFLPRYHRATNRLAAKVISDFRELRSAAEIARRNNISPPTALRYFKLVSYSCKQLPEVLSIDEFKGNAGGEKFQTIVTDAHNKGITDILPNRKKSDLIKYFRSFENRKDVKYVVIDMNPHFREVARICFPNAKIVIDRYHVSRQAMWALEVYPRLTRAHTPDASEEVRAIPFPPCGENSIMLSPSSFFLTNPLRWALFGGCEKGRAFSP